jgi:phosphatidate cytidylyltransferase
VLAKRILTAGVLLPVVVLLVRLDPPVYFFVLACAVIVLAVLELYRLAERRGAHPQRWVGVPGAVLVASSFLATGPDLRAVLAACAIASPLAALAARQPLQEALASISITLFGVLFLGLLIGYQVGLRGIEGVGAQLVLFLLWVVWISDAAAYFVGTRFGRRPLAPGISPKKTLEGTVAGLVGAVLAAWAGKVWFMESLPGRDAVILGILMGGFALAGDLCESLLKRGSEVKDSAALLPGHGGMLDRTDSLLFTAPILYHYWKWLGI